MNPFEFVLLLLGMIFLFKLMSNKAAARRERPGFDHPSVDEHGETRQLRDEVRQLKERLAVLERITVEKSTLR